MSCTAIILCYEHAWSDDEEESRRFGNGEDIRYLPLIDRKLRLRAGVLKRSERLLYCDHIDGDGEALFRLACEHDLEGIVAKRKSDPYLPEHAQSLKIRNREYSQWAGREELFERERSTGIEVARRSVEPWFDCDPANVRPLQHAARC